MKLKRLIAALVVACSLTVMALPVSAAPSSFRDVSDSTTAVNADTLRLMGVVSGSGSNTFSPGQNLTRAEFCVMAVKVMLRGDEVPIHTTRTIFTDVTARHWARGYINLAASITVDGDGEKAGSRLISGVGTGAFQPNDPITYAQAVTILMRMLGYSDDRVGAVWPAGYLNLAASLGLTKDLALSAGAPITRAQAAQLFVNMLRTETENGQTYCNTLGNAQENVMLLAVGVEADDNSPGAIRTSAGTYQPEVDGVLPTALQGRKGTLVLNERNRIVAFVPDGSSSVTVTLSGDAEATYLTASGGKRYTIAAKTPAFTSGSEAATSTYADIWMDLHAGAQVTLFLDDGQVIGVYYARTGSSSEAMVITGPVTKESFVPLTGGVTDFSIQKNRQEIRLSDIQMYDVVTYDAAANVLEVSDLRLSCVYESAAPNPKTPTSLTALGHEFTVLASAIDSVSQFSVGKNVTLLLTADGNVAGMMEPSARYRSTAIGLADGSSVYMLMPNGSTLELKSTSALPDNAQGHLVSLGSSKAGVISATRLYEHGAPGDFDVEDMTLGKYTVAAGVSVFERVGAGTVVRTNLSDIQAHTIPRDQIANYHLNSSDMVDVIVLDSATGDAYEYGRFEIHFDDAEGEDTISNRLLVFSNSTGSTQLKEGAGARKDGTFTGAVISSDGRLLASLKLTAIENVDSSDFFTKNGINYVSANNTTYAVSDQVEAFRSDSKTWVTEGDVLKAIRGYSDDLTIYIDPIGQKVRIIEAN